MKRILADINIAGHVERLFQIIEGDFWGEVWADLNLQRRSFADRGIQQEATDLELWTACQREEVVLVTANRRAKTDDSLESTIRLYNTPRSLLVFTLANSERILSDRDYAETVVVKFLEYLLDIDNFRGAGRLYLP